MERRVSHRATTSSCYKRRLVLLACAFDEARGGQFLDTASSLLLCATFCTIPKFFFRLIFILFRSLRHALYLLQLVYCGYKLCFFFLSAYLGSARSNGVHGHAERFERTTYYGVTVFSD
jgi:hypothetical protein